MAGGSMRTTKIKMTSASEMGRSTNVMRSPFATPVFPAGRRTGTGNALCESPPPTGSGPPFWQTCPLRQERREDAVVLDELVEGHAVEARRGRHDDVGDARDGRALLHAPPDLRGRPEPPVDADTGVREGTRTQAFKLGAEFLRPGLYLFPRQLVGPARGPGAEVGEADTGLEQPRVLLGSVEPAGDAGGEEEAPEAVAGMSVVIAAATRSERGVVPAEDELEARFQEVRGQGTSGFPYPSSGRSVRRVVSSEGGRVSETSSGLSSAVSSSWSGPPSTRTSCSDSGPPAPSARVRLRGLTSVVSRSLAPGLSSRLGMVRGSDSCEVLVEPPFRERRRPPSSGNTMSLMVALSSVTRRPVRLWMRSEMRRRTSSTTSRMFMPYSTPIVRSMATSVVPTSTETPRVWPSEPVMEPMIPPAALEALPPMWVPSTSCAAMPAIWATTESLMMVLPRSLTSGLPVCGWLCSLISDPPPLTKGLRLS